MRTMGGYGKTCGFLHFPFWEKMKHQFRSCFALTPRCFIFSIELLPRVKERLCKIWHYSIIMTNKSLTTIQLCIKMVITYSKFAMLYTEKW